MMAKHEDDERAAHFRQYRYVPGMREAQYGPALTICWRVIEEGQRACIKPRGHDAGVHEPPVPAQKTTTPEEAWAQVLAEQMRAVGCETPRVLAAIRAFGLAVLQARRTPSPELIACSLHVGDYDDCWVDADLKDRIEKLSW